MMQDDKVQAFRDLVIKRPAIKFHGSKWKLFTWLSQFIPSHDYYIEPFCGSASFFFRKEQSQVEVLNDRDGLVTNFLRVLRDKPDELMYAIRLTPWSREEQKIAVSSVRALRDNNELYGDVEKARLFYVHMLMQFGSGIITDGGFRTQKAPKGSKRIVDEINDIEHLYVASQRLTQAIIDNRDSLDVIDKYGSPESFIYVDPPYVKSTRYRKSKYFHEMSDEEHIALADSLNSVGAMVMISAYESELYNDIYSGWAIHRKETLTHEKTYKSECVYLSPSLVDAIKHE